jgi:hypothetical protein
VALFGSGPDSYQRGECNDGLTFCQVGNAVLKVSAQSLTGSLVYNVARNALTCSRDRVAISLAPATESDLLDALESVNGSARLRIQEFLRIVRDEPAQPTLIQIVNAREIGATEKVLRVVRDDTGKMTAAVSELSLEKGRALSQQIARCAVHGRRVDSGCPRIFCRDKIGRVVIGPITIMPFTISRGLVRIQRSSARFSAVLLKRKARASLSSDRPRSLFLTLLKNRTVSWCLPGNLGRLFDFLIR